MRLAAFLLPLTLRGCVLLVAALALLLPVQARAEGQVALYASPSTRAYLPGVGGSHDALLGPWRRLLQGRGHVFRELHSPEELAALTVMARAGHPG
jgi:hypothetical protein